MLKWKVKGHVHFPVWCISCHPTQQKGSSKRQDFHYSAMVLYVTLVKMWIEHPK